MASFTAPSPSPASAITRATFVPKGAVTVLSSPVLGFPRIGVRSGKVRCSASLEKLSASAVAAGLMASVSGPALALVDERLSTEGTGLPFGLSNNLLGWILFGVFGLIWSLYFVYASTLDEDDDSGLSL